MRLTKKNNNVRKENVIRSRKNNISRDSEAANYSHRIYDKGNIYLQNLLKTNEDFRSKNIKMPIDSNNLMNLEDNLHNIVSSEEKRQKAISYILNSLNERNMEKYNKMKLLKINNNYNDFPTEDENIIFDSNDFNIDVKKKKYIKNNNINDKYKKREVNDTYKIESPLKKKEIFKLMNENRFKNDSKKINLDNLNNNMHTPKKQKEYIYNIEENVSIKDNNSKTSFNNLKENINKKYDKLCNINRKKDLAKKLNLMSVEERKNLKIISDNRTVHNKHFIQKMRSPKASTSKRRFSPFKDILSKSSNNFFINKIPVNNKDNEYYNNLSIRKFDDKKSFSKRIINKEQASIYKYINNDSLINPTNANKSYIKINNSFLKNTSLIYRNKKVIDKKIVQSNSLNNKSNRNKYKKNYISINSKAINDKNENENESENEIEIKINENIDINEKNEKEKKMNDISINKEELKKYLKYFIKDITPININQFVIYSHSNNNYKNNEKNEEIFTVNKNFISSKKEQDINNNTYINGFKNLKLKENIFGFENNNNSMNKIHVKKRPLNENNSPDKSDINNKYTGFSICKYNKGETILNLPINSNNIYIINQFLKESGFEIKEIQSKVLASKEKTIQRNKINLTNQKIDSSRKKKNNTNIEVRKSLNKKENSKIKDSILNTSSTKRLKNENKKKLKKITKTLNENQYNNSKEKRNLKKRNEKNASQSKIIVKLNENFEDIEKNYLNKNKEKRNNNNLENILKEDDVCQKIKVSATSLLQ